MISTHRIHGTGIIPIHEWLCFVLMVSYIVAKYASPMNPMEDSLKHERLEPENHPVEQENHLNQISKPTDKNCSGSSRFLNLPGCIVFPVYKSVGYGFLPTSNLVEIPGLLGAVGGGS